MSRPVLAMPIRPAPYYCRALVSRDETQREEDNVRHLTLRVAWHDRAWDGAVCDHPVGNAFCLALDRVRESRDDAYEERSPDAHWADLIRMPCRRAARGRRIHERARVDPRPPASLPGGQQDPGHAWSPAPDAGQSSAVLDLRGAVRVDDTSGPGRDRGPAPGPASGGSGAAVPHAWVFGRQRQEALLATFFDALTPGESLVFFYTKEGQPISDAINRLVVGVGPSDEGRSAARVRQRRKQSRVSDVGPARPSLDPAGWDRRVPSALPRVPRADRRSGRRRAAAGAPPRDRSRPRARAHAGVLVLLGARLGRRRPLHAGPLPRFGPAHPQPRHRRGAVGTPRRVAERADRPDLGRPRRLPWAGCGTRGAGHAARDGAGPRTRRRRACRRRTRIRGRSSTRCFAARSIRRSERTRRTSRRFEPHGRSSPTSAVRCCSSSRGSPSRPIKPAAGSRWHGATPPRRRRVSDREILDNPYRIAECDLGTLDDPAVSVGMVDRGLLPDPTVAVNCPVPERSRVDSPGDRRRVRGAAVSVLRRAADDGDSLLSAVEVLDAARAPRPGATLRRAARLVPWQRGLPRPGRQADRGGGPDRRGEASRSSSPRSSSRATRTPSCGSGESCSSGRRRSFPRSARSGVTF